MYNFIKNAVIAVCIGLLTIPFFCSCQKKDNYDATYGIMSAKEYNTFANHILSIKPDYPLDSSWIRYDDVKKDSDELVEIGYEGLPVLIQIMNEQANNDNYSFFDLSFWSAGTCAILRIDPNHKYMSYTLDGEHYNPCHKESICLFYEKSIEEIPQILFSELNTEEKIFQLRYYGIFAIPFVVAEIEDGKTEYIPFFIEIGLHLSVPEYMEYMTIYNSTYNDIPINERYINIRNDPKAKDFDYRVWLSENEEDLDNLFKFLDAYCAEYEAENKS